ncbi:GNAT family N-acetyltransferase [Lagierella sp.]|uniref:GNAT family N-acetyltransferase n=1 Tax=Lagierella sp. TaxID=2849657 RepID=UPI0026340EBB|nr:GNAT family N-acetyltransferase [Lagierella sp.]
MDYVEKAPQAEDYLKLRKEANMGGNKTITQVEKALKGSLYIICVYEDSELIGLGRVVGDGGITFAITDIMVSEKYQKKGIGNEIMNHIDRWFEENTAGEKFIMIHANPPADRLYLKHGYDYIYPERVGMLKK